MSIFGMQVTVILKTILKTSFGDEYESRSKEEESLRGGVSSPSSNVGTVSGPLPLFVMSPLLPGEVMALNIFEPRYRLMIRRCMEGGRCFGMAMLSSSGDIHDVACAAEIKECEPLPDGRFYIEIRGTQRFRPLDVGELDGYRIARPEWIKDDESFEPGTEEYEAVESLVMEVMELASSWLERLRVMSQTRRGLLQLLAQLDDGPSDPNDKECVSFWACTLLTPLLDARQLHSYKLRMLTTRSTSERLVMCRELLSSHQMNLGGCGIM